MQFMCLVAAYFKMKPRNKNAVQLSTLSHVILHTAVQAAPSSVQGSFNTVHPLRNVISCFFETFLSHVPSISLFSLETVLILSAL